MSVLFLLRGHYASVKLALDPSRFQSVLFSSAKMASVDVCVSLLPAVAVVSRRSVNSSQMSLVPLRVLCLERVGFLFPHIFECICFRIRLPRL